MMNARNVIAASAPGLSIGTGVYLGSGSVLGALLMGAFCTLFGWVLVRTPRRAKTGERDSLGALRLSEDERIEQDAAQWAAAQLADPEWLAEHGMPATAALLTPPPSVNDVIEAAHGEHVVSEQSCGCRVTSTGPNRFGHDLCAIHERALDAPLRRHAGPTASIERPHDQLRQALAEAERLTLELEQHLAERKGDTPPRRPYLLPPDAVPARRARLHDRIRAGLAREVSREAAQEFKTAFIAARKSTGRKPPIVLGSEPTITPIPPPPPGTKTVPSRGPGLTVVCPECGEKGARSGFRSGAPWAAPVGHTREGEWHFRCPRGGRVVWVTPPEFVDGCGDPSCEPVFDPDTRELLGWLHTAAAFRGGRYPLFPPEHGGLR